MRQHPLCASLYHARTNTKPPAVTLSPPIAAIILAAGLSSRVAPANKLLAPLADGHALITHTARNALASNASPVIVVTGFQAPLIEHALTGLPTRITHAPTFATGIAASLRAGILALPPETQAALIMLGDMPLVPPTLLNQLLAAYHPQSGHNIVVPTWQGQRGNPRLWGQNYFATLQSLSGDTGANHLLNNHPNHIAEVASPTNAILRDFDTQQALNALLSDQTERGPEIK